MKKHNIVGSIIKKRRNGLNITLAQLAKKTKINYPQFIYAIESGRSPLPPSKIKIFAKALRLDKKEFACAVVLEFELKIHEAIK